MTITLMNLSAHNFWAHKLIQREVKMELTQDGQRPVKSLYSALITTILLLQYYCQLYDHKQRYHNDYDHLTEFVNHTQENSQGGYNIKVATILRIYEYAGLYWWWHDVTEGARNSVVLKKLKFAPILGRHSWMALST